MSSFTKCSHGQTISATGRRESQQRNGHPRAPRRIQDKRICFCYDDFTAPVAQLDRASAYEAEG